ncbi:MAG TPA: DUF2254 family protein, partial [Gemmatimonadaceae bacterium]|nr:DUF2254 family protein [Gemmatimonadaceae bacterium]
TPRYERQTRHIHSWSGIFMFRSETPSDRLFAPLKRAFRQFLALPLLVVIGFILLGVVIYGADDAWSRGGVPPGFGWLGDILGDSEALNTLLSTVASSIITVTSITFSLLLIALQQGASTLTTHVTDQFLMRRMNQFYFGFFVGLSIYVLQTLVTVSDTHRPIFGTSVALLLTIIALCLIVVMIYNTIDQMRPTQIVRAIHAHILDGRSIEMEFLARTRRTPRPDFVAAGTLRSRETGHVAAFEIAPLQKLISDEFSGRVEVELNTRIGSYIAQHDPLAVLRVCGGTTLDKSATQKLNDAMFAAIVIDNERDLSEDPRYGIYQLSTIAWTAISTAKSNPSPGRDVVNAIRDILARWSAQTREVKEDPDSAFVYADNTPMEAINVLETAILVASESMQAQTLTDALHTITMLLEEAPQPWAERLADVVRRALSSLGDHVLTRDLERALLDLERGLRKRGFAETAHAVATAIAQFALSLGHINSRATRVAVAHGA